MDRFISALVEFSRRNAKGLIAAVLALAILGGYYVARHIKIDSDTSKLVDPNLPWQKASNDLDQQFPQNQDLLVVVVDGPTASQSADAATELARRLRAQPNLFRYVRQPDANPYFKRYGLLFLSQPEVQDFSDHIISAQPFLGTLAADPSLRGVLNAIDLLALGALHGAVDAAQINGPLEMVATSAEAAVAKKSTPLTWDSMLSGRKSDPDQLRHFILARTALSFGKVTAAADAIAAIKKAAADAHLGPENGIRVRITGTVALNNDQLAALSDGAVFSTVLCLGLLCFWLVVGLRSAKAVGAIVITLLCGLVGCAAFAVCFIGPFNPVSIAFAPLFIGIAIDFGIQFSVRYAAERLEGEPTEAMRRTAAGTGAPLAVAAAATAVGFAAFAPTAYLGVRDLGLIAGAGMIIALFLNLTLLPALLTVFKAEGQRDSAGFSWGRPLDRFLVTKRRGVMAVALGLVALSAFALPHLKFNFNPVDLENPKAESVRTLFDLIADPHTSPYSIEFLLPKAEAIAAGDKLKALPEVSRVLRVDVLVPADQGPKLDVLTDTAELLDATLNPTTVKAAPTAEELLASVKNCADDMEKLGSQGNKPAARLGTALRRVAKGDPAQLAMLVQNLSSGIAARVDDLREVLKAAPVSLDNMPADFRQEWVAPDGRWRVQVFPAEDMRDNAKLRHFAKVVQDIVPGAVGSAISVAEWTALAPRAFATAGALALVIISVLLLIVLRRLQTVLMVLIPLLLAGIFTLAAAAVLGFSVNFANIITLPMMLGIGVAFDIYFVMRHRAGSSDLLGSPTGRGVVFSALTTGSAFGSLALADSKGMAEMGKFLGLALFFILACTLFILPALLGRHPRTVSDK